MKKIICILSSLVMVFGVSNFVHAQSPQTKQTAKEKRELRKAQQAAQDAVMEAKMDEALKGENFTFWANYLSAGSLIRQPINSGFKEFIIDGGMLTVRLPYISTSRDIATTPLVIDFKTKDYKYTYENRGGVFSVKISVNNVTNNQSTNKLHNSSYIFEFRISNNGSASLTVSPGYMSPITYDGSISIGSALD